MRWWLPLPLRRLRLSRMQPLVLGRVPLLLQVARPLFVRASPHQRLASVGGAGHRLLARSRLE